MAKSAFCNTVWLEWRYPARNQTNAQPELRIHPLYHDLGPTAMGQQIKTWYRWLPFASVGNSRFKGPDWVIDQRLITLEKSSFLVSGLSQCQWFTSHLLWFRRDSVWLHVEALERSADETTVWFPRFADFPLRALLAFRNIQISSCPERA